MAAECSVSQADGGPSLADSDLRSAPAEVKRVREDQPNCSHNTKSPHLLRASIMNGNCVLLIPCFQKPLHNERKCFISHLESRKNNAFTTRVVELTRKQNAI